jgi:hypothetical protein
VDHLDIGIGDQRPVVAVGAGDLQGVGLGARDRLVHLGQRHHFDVTQAAQRLGVDGSHHAAADDAGPDLLFHLSLTGRTSRTYYGSAAEIVFG